MLLEESEKSHCKGCGHKWGVGVGGLSVTLQSFCQMWSISGQKGEKSHSTPSQPKDTTLRQFLNSQPLPQSSAYIRARRGWRQGRGCLWDTMQAMIGNSNIDSELMESGPNFGVLFQTMYVISIPWTLWAVVANSEAKGILSLHIRLLQYYDTI